MHSIEERIFLVENYFSTRSYLKCQSAFREKYPHSTVPNKSTISRVVRNFRETGSVYDKTRCRKSTVLTQQKLAEVQGILKETPQTSLSKLQKQCSLSYGSANRATKILHMHSYKYAMVQETNGPDLAARTTYCKWFLQFVKKEGAAVLDRMFFSDQAWFHLDGHIKAQNSCTWSTKNSSDCWEKPSRSPKVGVWCAMSRKRIVGPLFFDQPITAEAYQDIIVQFISLLRPEERHCWFQQDDTPINAAISTKEMLEEFFEDRVIAHGLWPPRSPDLTPPHFFLWGMLEKRVYANNPCTIEDLKKNIVKGISEINESALHNAFQNMEERIHVCLSQKGGDFQHLL